MCFRYNINNILKFETASRYKEDIIFIYTYFKASIIININNVKPQSINFSSSSLWKSISIKKKKGASKLLIIRMSS